MSVKTITLAGKAMVKLPGGEKEVSYAYDKIITPGTKRNSGTDEERKASAYYTLAELVEFCNGCVEFQFEKDAKGEIVKDAEGFPKLLSDQPTPIVQYIIDGINVEKNRLAKEAKVNTPAVELTKQRILLVEMRTKQVKMGMDAAAIDTMIAMIDAKIKVLESDDNEAEEEQEQADKVEAAATRASRSPKTPKK
jgi:hypothetical protein